MKKIIYIPDHKRTEIPNGGAVEERISLMSEGDDNVRLLLELAQKKSPDVRCNFEVFLQRLDDMNIRGLQIAEVWNCVAEKIEPETPAQQGKQRLHEMYMNGLTALVLDFAMAGSNREQIASYVNSKHLGNEAIVEGGSAFREVCRKAGHSFPMISEATEVDKGTFVRAK